MDLTEILKGHEGEVFYCALTGGDATLLNVYESAIEFRRGELGPPITLASNGGFVISGECQVFPTEDQRDWHKWDKENNHKTFKTWSDIEKNSKKYYLKYIYKHLDHHCSLCEYSPIEKSAIAFLKIKQVIEDCYGGNTPVGFSINVDDEGFSVYNTYTYYKLFAFHTREQAEEFLSYPENIQLLKDFYMI